MYDKNKFRTHFNPIKMFMGNVTHSIKVTYLGKGIYECRVYTNGVLNAENRAYGQENIGPACRDLLRWESKLGNYSKYADSSRHRSAIKQNKRNVKNLQTSN